MFLIRSEAELLDAFRSHDRKRLGLPKNLKYPLVVRDYFAWTEPGSPRVQLVFVEPGVGKTIGLVFERSSSPSPSTGASCEWCHSFGSTNQIGMLTIEATARRTVGVNLCLDLSCRDKIETNTALSPVAAQKRGREVIESMSRFVRRLLL